MSFIDFNTADTGGGPQGNSLIPDNTVARAILTIRPGGAGDGGIMKMGPAGLMFDAEFTITEGPYAKRKVWKYMSMSEKAAPITMRQLRAVIEGHYGILPTDMSEAAQAKRKCTAEQLSGMECCILIGVEAATGQYEAKNTLKAVISPGEQKYIGRGQAAPAAPAGNVAAFHAPASAPVAPAPAAGAAKPAWAV